MPSARKGDEDKLPAAKDKSGKRSGSHWTDDELRMLAKAVKRTARFPQFKNETISRYNGEFWKEVKVQVHILLPDRFSSDGTSDGSAIAKVFWRSAEKATSPQIGDLDLPAGLQAIRRASETIFPVDDTDDTGCIISDDDPRCRKSAARLQRFIDRTLPGATLAAFKQPISGAKRGRPSERTAHNQRSSSLDSTDSSDSVGTTSYTRSDRVVSRAKSRFITEDDRSPAKRMRTEHFTADTDDELDTISEDFDDFQKFMLEAVRQLGELTSALIKAALAPPPPPPPQNTLLRDYLMYQMMETNRERLDEHRRRLDEERRAAAERRRREEAYAEERRAAEEHHQHMQRMLQMMTYSSMINR